MRIRVLMIAPPGAGKGTQGALIAAHFGIPRIATGELLRDHVARRTDLGLAVQGYLDRGELVPDQVVLDIAREALAAAKAAGGGYVLDGIPRNMPQARAAYLIARELGMTADVALHLDADDAEVTRRLLARAALEHRSDDTAEIIAQRLALYHQVTSPIICWYRDRGILVSVDAMRPAQQVGREILTALEAMRPLLDHEPAHTRHPVDLTTLGEAFGVTGPDAENGGDATRFLSLAQRRILAAACARLVPADDYGPGAVEAGAVDYIEGLLGAFLVYPPRIWAGGPFSGRFGGEASFASFHRLTAAEELAWRTRIEGSKGIAERERLGPVAGLQERYTEGLAALGDDFPALPPEEQDHRLRSVGSFLDLLYQHVCEGLYGAPEYGGNRDLAGWRSIGYLGDVQPRGYPDEEVSGA